MVFMPGYPEPGSYLNSRGRRSIPNGRKRKGKGEDEEEGGNYSERWLYENPTTAGSHESELPGPDRREMEKEKLRKTSGQLDAGGGLSSPRRAFDVIVRGLFNKRNRPFSPKGRTHSASSRTSNPEPWTDLVGPPDHGCMRSGGGPQEVIGGRRRGGGGGEEGVATPKRRCDRARGRAGEEREGACFCLFQISQSQSKNKVPREESLLYVESPGPTDATPSSITQVPPQSKANEKESFGREERRANHH
ncbi:hypothetical protein M407DRAFT_235691 [Tulasnella calospora MUT 4182]|uniref:Uncharacterized protein n=1 Tax=Tulasnella calospora MUT 4182 TaxID=1051891 RepID=A0A0C3QJ57_9AGAM|nr:hypothetical protein M407DRAFT_235691 [Tulasnella calospora MUT 4182]